MKHLTLFAAVTALSLTAVAQTQSAQQKLQMELSKSYGTQQGVEIRMPSKQAMDQAIQQLGGKITVEFGKNNKVEMLKASTGGVVIGSGADGLVASSNMEANAPVIVPVPLQPKMSITVVAPSAMKFCASYIKKDEHGNYQKSTVTEGNSKCNNGGDPIRLQKSGAYVVYRQRDFDMVRGGRIFVEVADGENKVVPMRQLIIPAIQTNKWISAYLYEDLESSEFMRKQLATMFYVRELSNYFENHKNSDAVKNLEDYYANFKVLSVEEGFVFRHSSSFGNTEYFGLNFSKESFNGDEYKSGEPLTFYVFPGVYGIAWSINGSLEVTKGIYVQ